MEHLDADLDKARSQVMAIAQKVQSSLEQTYHLSQERSDKDRLSVDHHCTSSIGVTLFVGHQDPDVLLFRVDKAMYQAKASGKNRIEFA